ncbi:hypothetical protein SD77_2984 [Bacillus badius]|uniref:Uncharacterized protein n=1 Tax=Bacillus badius TaxID=1455 RepID=A0ABR5AQ95_BACBA|nr:hypothetical protein SD77_2984 [Bacillus badius]
MSLIIKSKVQSARKTYHCDDCGKPILNKEKYRYFFGAPDKRDKPYSLRICKGCDTFKEDY